MNFEWSIIYNSLPLLGQGFVMTIVLVVVSGLIGCVLGSILCFGKLTKKGPFFWLSSIFIDLFRTLPEMVTVFWIYSCLPLLFDLKISAFGCGIIALAVFAAAYIAEVFRAGIQAVPKGQIEAAYVLGLPVHTIWISIIIPQAIRIMMPAFILFLTDLVKASGLLASISVGELVFQAITLASGSFRYFELFTFVGLCYFAILFPLSMIAQTLERRAAKRAV